MDWTEVTIEVGADDLDRASDIAQMVVPYGIYIEDYRTLEQDAWEIAHIDLIDEALLQKDRSKGVIHVYIGPEESPAEAVAFLSERYRTQGVRHAISTAACRREDWENNWKAYFKPMPVGQKLLIQPLWEQDAPAQGRAVLRIEPGLAFGTGGHDTTRLCMELLEELVTPGMEVLDVGCGSGILSIAALLLGARRAVGVDIDELAVKTARENGAQNGFSAPQYTVLHGDLAEQVTGQYDIVVTNIVADIIISFAGQVAPFMKPGACFLTSGIIDDREAEVLAALQSNGFSVAQRRERGGWVCLCARRTEEAFPVV